MMYSGRCQGLTNVPFFLQILYTIYSPAEHDPSSVHKTKEEGDELEEAGKDEAPEWSQKSKAENAKK